MTDEELNVLTDILCQCSWKFSAKFNYINQKGIKSKKHVEVYDVNKQTLSFFAYDLVDQKPKNFKIDQLKDYIEIGEEFTPRYERK